MALGTQRLAAVALDRFARGGGSLGFLGPLLGIVFLLLVLIAMRIWFNRPDKL